MDGPPPGSGGGGESTAAAVLALHLVWMALEAASEALLPLWMLSPGRRGCRLETGRVGGAAAEVFLQNFVRWCLCYVTIRFC